jgi:hypothetical protein
MFTSSQPIVPAAVGNYFPEGINLFPATEAITRDETNFSDTEAATSDGNKVDSTSPSEYLNDEIEFKENLSQIEYLRIELRKVRGLQGGHHVLNEIGRYKFKSSEDVITYVHAVYGRVLSKTMVSVSVNSKKMLYLIYLGFPKSNQNKIFVCQGCQGVVFLFRPFTETIIQKDGIKKKEIKFYKLDTTISKAEHHSVENNSILKVPCTCNTYTAPHRILLLDNDIGMQIIPNKGTTGIGSRNNDTKEIIKQLGKMTEPVEMTKDKVNKISSKLLANEYDEHLSSINFIEPMLLKLQQHCPSFKYQIVRCGPNNFDMKRVIILLPYAVKYLDSDYACKLIGLDGAHNKNVLMKKEEESEHGRQQQPSGSTNDVNQKRNKSNKVMFVKTKLLAIATRTPANRLLLLAFSLTYSESAEEFTCLLNFCNSNGLALDKEDITVVTDRAEAINSSIKTCMPNAYHALCLKHMERNLRDHNSGLMKDDKWIKKFKKIYFAETPEEYTIRMNSLMLENPTMHSYISSINNWQRWKLYERLV